MDKKFIYNNIKRHNVLILFFVFLLFTYLKCIYFENVIYGYISSEFFICHLPKIVISLLLASPILILKNYGKWYALIISLFIDIWFISNFIYFRSNNTVLNAMSLSMAGNMDGFWNSVLLFIKPATDVIPLLLTLCMVFLFRFKYENRYKLYFAIILLSIYPLSLISHYYYVDKEGYWNFDIKLEPTNLHKVLCLSEYKKDSSDPQLMFEMDARENSGIHLFINDIILLNHVKDGADAIELSDEDIAKLSNIGIKKGLSNSKKFKDKLVIILVESFENWAITQEAMPNLYTFLQNNNHLYAKRVISQVKQGTSADGQMIINTGLLPINQGAACYRFCNSTYPSLSKLTDNKSLNIIPHKLSVWNQSGMSAAYGYTFNHVSDPSDEILFSKLNEEIEKNEYGMIELVTLSTHAPFTLIADKSSLQLPDDMPLLSRNYLKSFNYFDKCIASFLNKIQTDPNYQNITVLITGDHIIFPTDKRTEQKEYSMKHNNEYNPEPYVAAIFFSPKINGKIDYEKECYQMDLFPTLTSLLGCEYDNYKGFGINLLDSTQIRNIDENSAYNLSDKIIRGNFFKE